MIPILIKCYLRKDGDDDNKIELTQTHLIVTQKGETDSYTYDQVQSIKIAPKKLIIPLVLGGVGTCFSLLALSMGWYHYQLNLLTVFLFFGWMYYGFNGRDAIVIDEKSHQTLYLIQANKEMVRSFISFFQERRWKVGLLQPELIYHTVPLDDWIQQSTSYHYKHPSLQTEGFIHASTESQLGESIRLHTDPHVTHVVLFIHTPWLTEELKWEYAPKREQDFPHIHGPINKNAILEIMLLENKPNVNYILS